MRPSAWVWRLSRKLFAVRARAGWSSLLALCGCFREPDGSRAPPLELQIRDLHGATASTAQVPRDVELTLTFEGAPPDDVGLEPRLVRGSLSPELAQVLTFERPNAALSSALAPLHVRRAKHALLVRPEQPLLPGGRYTVVWPLGQDTRTFTFRVSTSPALGARWVESAPGDGAMRVPPNLGRALVRFDGHVRGALDTAVQLRGADGSPLAASVRVERCRTYGLPEGDCAWLSPHASLAEGTYQLAVEGALETPSGAPITPVAHTFTVATEEDRTPPSLSGAHCDRDERTLAGACIQADDRTLSVRGSVDEPVFASLLLMGAAPSRAMALSYAGEFTLAIQPRDERGRATLRLMDLAGNVSEFALAYELARDLASVTIDEVRADPRGPEPAQEYVELLNFGTESVSLMGFSLSTEESERGRTVMASPMLAPGERALLVGPAFDPRDDRDGALPSSVRVIALSGALSLANAGSSLLLRDERGRRIAAARSLPAWLEGQCTHRVGDALRSGDAAAWELDAYGRCTPGSASIAEDAAP